MSKEFQLTVDAEAMIKAYESAPDKTRKMVRIQLKAAVERIKNYAQKHHRYISRTAHGLEAEGIATSVDDNKGMLWLNLAKIKYARAIHQGRGPMVIVPRKKKWLRWVNKAGDGFVFKKRVEIPALKPDPFLYQAVDHEKAGIQQDFAKALQKALEDL